MKYKKHIIGFLFLIFSFTTANIFSYGVSSFKFQKKQNEQTSIVFENNKTENNQNIVSIEGTLQSSLKTNENNHFRFPVFKKSKKNNALHFSSNQVIFSTSYFTFYRSFRINRIKFSPFYIAYHRLLI